MLNYFSTTSCISRSTHLNRATELPITLHRDRVIHGVLALQLQEEHSRILRFLHIQHVLHVEIVPHEYTLARIPEASFERKTRDPGTVRNRTVFVVQRDQLGFRAEGHIRVHLDDRTRPGQTKKFIQKPPKERSVGDPRKCSFRRLPEEHRRCRLVRPDHQIWVDIAVEVETAGH